MLFSYRKFRIHYNNNKSSERVKRYNMYIKKNHHEHVIFKPYAGGQNVHVCSIIFRSDASFRCRSLHCTSVTFQYLTNPLVVFRLSHVNVFITNIKNTIKFIVFYLMVQTTTALFTIGVHNEITLVRIQHYNKMNYGRERFFLTLFKF